MNVVIDNPFTHGISQTKERIVELIEVVSKHPLTKVHTEDDKELYGYGTLEKDVSISYNNLTILVTKIEIFVIGSFEELAPLSYTIDFSIEDRKYKYPFISLDAEFIKLLMEAL